MRLVTLSSPMLSSSRAVGDAGSHGSTRPSAEVQYNCISAAIARRQQPTPCRVTLRHQVVPSWTPWPKWALRPCQGKTTVIVLPKGGKLNKLHALGVETKQSIQPKTLFLLQSTNYSKPGYSESSPYFSNKANPVGILQKPKAADLAKQLSESELFLSYCCAPQGGSQHYSCWLC